MAVEESTKKSSSREEATAGGQPHQHQRGVVADQAEATREVQPGEEREGTKRRSACDHCSVKKIRVSGASPSEKKNKQRERERQTERESGRERETWGISNF